MNRPYTEIYTRKEERNYNELVAKRWQELSRMTTSALGIRAEINCGTQMEESCSRPEAMETAGEGLCQKAY